MSRKSLSLLALLILTGTFLRLFRFDQTYLLESDQAMAFLLANRIINFGHILLVGPNTSFYGVNFLPPTYYYLITLYYFFWRNEVGVSLIFTFIGIMSIPLIYLLAKEMALSTKTALIAAFFYTFSFTLIKYSRNIWEPHLVPFFVLLSYLFAFRAARLKKFKLYILSSIFFLISLMYVSSFLIFPAYILMIFFLLKKGRLKFKINALKLSLIFISLLLLIYLPNFIFEITNKWPSIGYIIDFPLIETSLYSANLWNQISVFIYSLFPLPSFFIMAILSATLILGIFHSVKSNKNFIYIILPAISAMLIIGFYAKDAYPHRFAAMYPFFILLISSLLTKLFASQTILVFRFLQHILAIAVLVIFFSSNLKIYNRLIQRQGSETIKATSEIARYLLKETGNDSFSLYVATPYNQTNYNNVPYIYLMEKYSRKKLYPFHLYGNWIDSSLNKNAQWIYLICEDFSQLHLQKNCLNKFLMDYSITFPMVSLEFSEDRVVYKFSDN